MTFHLRFRRSLGISIFVLVSLPIAYVTMKTGIDYLGEPELFEGDRSEMRDCRMCGGTGKDEALGREVPGMGTGCPFCRGRGSVKVILPGPRRPTRLWVAVVDAGTRDGLYRYHTPESLRRLNPASSLFPEKGPGKPLEIPGAIAFAKVVFFTGTGAPLELKTDNTGRFSRRLAPGAYRVQVSAVGFEPLEGEVEIQPLSEPIWLEKATLVQPPESEAEARSVYGLHFLAGLSRAGGGGFLRVTPGSP